MSMIPPWRKWLQQISFPAKKSLPRLNRHGRLILAAGLALVLLPSLAYGLFRLSYHNRVFPGVMIANQSVRGLDESQLNQIVGRALADYHRQWPLTLTYQDRQWQAEAGLIDFDIQATAKTALQQGRTGSLLTQIRQQLALAQKPVTLPLTTRVNQSVADPLIASIAASVNQEVIEPELTVLAEVDPTTQSRLVLTPGVSGQRFDKQTWIRHLIDSTSLLATPTDQVPIEAVQPTYTQTETSAGMERAQQLLDASLNLTAGSTVEQSWSLNDTELISFIDFADRYSLSKIRHYLQPVSQVVNREPINAKFNFDANTNRVTEFAAAKPGLELDVDQSAQAIFQALVELETETEPSSQVTLVVSETQPEITLDNVNDLGIKELLGRGTSTYTGSIASRVHNVALAAARINGVLIKPGEEFSFNSAIGDISAATGYQAAYVIRNGRTELGDGGGVCQDSTTVFRAALDAGLPITNRRAHSYRVGYYEQNAKPGLDATVFSPSVDLKFLNDTPAHILLQAKADSANRSLVVELYGTSDGRTSEVSNHVVWDVTPPPPDVYVDDPTLGAGNVKQVDWKAWGAKAKFDYVVKRNGETLIEKTFTSVYRPWAAVFLRGV